MILRLGGFTMALFMAANTGSDEGNFKLNFSTSLVTGSPTSTNKYFTNPENGLLKLMPSPSAAKTLILLDHWYADHSSVLTYCMTAMSRMPPGLAPLFRKKGYHLHGTFARCNVQHSHT